MFVTLIDGEHRYTVERTSTADTLAVRSDSFETATGWALKPQGWCRGDVCVPVATTAAGEVDLAQFAAVMRRPAVIDQARGVAALGMSGHDRAEAMLSLQAENMTFPDLDGNPVSIHDFHRRKRLLLAWSSW